MPNENIASRLQALRDKLGVSQEVVAEACDISRVSLARYELGTREPKLDIAARLASYYGVTVEYLRSGQQAPSAPADHTRETFLARVSKLPPEKQEQLASYLKFLEQEEQKK